MVQIEKVTRETFPTASYTLRVSDIRWLKEEAARRGMRGPSELLRALIDEHTSAAPEVETTDDRIPA